MKKIITRIIFLIALVVFAYSGYQIIDIKLDNYQESKEKDMLLEVSKMDKFEKEEIKDEKEVVDYEIDFDNLLKINSDIVAWIYLPDTNINYPIVQGSDNDFYLNHGFQKEFNYAGAIFMDYRSNNDFTDNNTIIYGHNMWHDTMFTHIEKMKDETFFKNHPYVYIYTKDGNYRGEVISVYTTTYDSANFEFFVNDELSYQAYIDLIKDSSDFKTEVEVSTADKMVTLVTCSHEYRNQSSDLRYLLHVKLVKSDT